MGWGNHAIEHGKYKTANKHHFTHNKARLGQRKGQGHTAVLI